MAVSKGVGLVGGTIVQCSAEDQSMYCKFARLVQIITWIFLFGFMVWFLMDILKKKSK